VAAVPGSPQYILVLCFHVLSSLRAHTKGAPWKESGNCYCMVGCDFYYNASLAVL